MSKHEESIQEGNNDQAQTWFYSIQIGLRATVLATSLAASCLTFTNDQTTLVYGVPMDAKYSYTLAFKFFAVATAITSVFALVTLVLTLILRWKGTLKAKLHYLFFLHDLVMAIFLVGATAAATAIGYVGKYGNDHAGWVPICDSFHGFCHKGMIAITLGFVGFFCFLALTIISATKSTHQVTTAAQVQNI